MFTACLHPSSPRFSMNFLAECAAELVFPTNLASALCRFAASSTRSVCEWSLPNWHRWRQKCRRGANGLGSLTVLAGEHLVLRHRAVSLAGQVDEFLKREHQKRRRSLKRPHQVPKLGNRRRGFGHCCLHALVFHQEEDLRQGIGGRGRKGLEGRSGSLVVD